MARKTRSRSRARARSAPRRTGSRSSRTSTTSISSRSGDGLGKYILPAVAVGIVAYLLWPKTASAADGRDGRDGNNQNNQDKNNPNNRPNNRPNNGGGGFPAGATLGVVAVTTGESGMNVRSSPSPGATLVTALPNGTTFQILAADIAETGIDTPGRNRWMHIRTSNGTQGYLRAIGPAGESNVRTTTGPNTGAFYGGYTPYTPFGALMPQGVVAARGWYPAYRGW